VRYLEVKRSQIFLGFRLLEVGKYCMKMHTVRLRMNLKSMKNVNFRDIYQEILKNVGILSFKQNLLLPLV
jgi:hypothetical protein